MTAKVTANEWIDRYMNEVGRRLPASQRADLQREIRSLIEDEVAGQWEAQADKGPTQGDKEATVLAVLHRFGSPATMAARYHPPQYLIGPALFPIFRIVLSIVLAVLLGVSLFGFVVAAATKVVPPLGETLLDLFGGLVQAAGMVTLVFAILERFGVNPDTKPEDWDPAKLPPIQDPGRVNMVETAVDIGITAAAVILLNYFVATGSGVYYNQGEWHSFPLFSSTFAQYVPWLTAVWLVDIAVNCVLLARGRWEIGTRLATVITAAAGALVYYRMLTGDPLAAWSVLEPAFKITAAILFVISLVEIGKQGWRMVGRWPQLQHAA